MNNKEDYFKIMLNGFLLNAGVVGLYRLLKFAEAEKGKDYYYEEQCFYLSKAYIQSVDLADLYVKSMVDYFKEQTKFYEIIGKKGIVAKLTEEIVKNPDKKIEKSLNALYSEFTKMLEKNSFQSGYSILSEMGVNCPILELIKALKQQNDYQIKLQLYNDLITLCEQPNMQEILIFKELMYSRINMFWEGTSFFIPANLKSNIHKCYEKEFITPILDMITNTKQGKKCCIDCGSYVSDTKSISFMQDMLDDPARKKSYYWNQKPDANLCPVCAFLYSLVPLGFGTLGFDAVFINNNSDVDSLIKINSTFAEKTDLSEEKKDLSKFKLYNIFIGFEIDILLQRIDNIQIIIRSRKTEKYNLNIIGKDTVRILKDSSKYISFTKGISVKIDTENYINVYDEIISNVVNNRNQFSLINKLIKIGLNDNGKTDYILSILLTQHISKGGNKVEDNIKLAYVIKKQGEELRKLLSNNEIEKSADNKVRGFTYQLLNALSVNKREQFLNLVIRIYSSYSQPIPDLFLQCFSSDDAFQSFGYAFILGLKSDGNNTKIERNEQNNAK